MLRYNNYNNIWEIATFSSLAVITTIIFYLFSFFKENTSNAPIYYLFITILVFSICLCLLLQKKNSTDDYFNWQRRVFWWSLTQNEFKKEVTKILKNRGYKTKINSKNENSNIDIVMHKDGKTFIVQCKHYQNPVPPEPIRALWGCKDYFNADEVILITSSGITEDGVKFVRSKDNFVIYTLDDIILMSKKIVLDKDRNKE